ncbi:MAG: hypothetical protein JO360_05245 [Acidobacteria bacterium]|nr:hypothetical protein [Acidobacteriota bacterium]
MRKLLWLLLLSLASGGASMAQTVAPIGELRKLFEYDQKLPLDLSWTGFSKP